MKYAVLLSFALLTSCNYLVDNREPGAMSQLKPRGSNSGAGEASGPDLSFKNVSENAIQTSCFGCHKAPRNAGGLNLEKYETVFARRNDIAEAVRTHYMPDSKGRMMSDEARALLLQWIEAGAPFATPPRPSPSPRSSSQDL